ncbi:MAG: hypothetical protein OXI81_04245 [Paracoccaceae bacterium]|nr:hypothetical protein [Paracoccaceae bacterium]
MAAQMASDPGLANPTPFSISAPWTFPALSTRGGLGSANLAGTDDRVKWLGWAEGRE